MRWSDVHDVLDIGTRCYEIFLADDDLERHYDTMTEVFGSGRFGNTELVVHAPHAFSPETPWRLIDLSSPDRNTREESIETILRALDLVSAVSASYLVVHPGGISRHLLPERERLYANLLSSLQEIGSPRIILENMPWFYWIGNERYTSNILVFPEEFEGFLPYCGGICLDLCHAYLSQETGSAETILDFFRRYPGRIRHLHVSDAVSPDGEGLQLGDGVVDFQGLFDEIHSIVAARAGNDEEQGSSRYRYTMIPEIKGGHQNRSAVSKEGLERLRNLLTSSKWALEEAQ